tara:strand:- start:155 stop:316 length:162 start_codon:yes stop_codon:yes gene_type:complete
LKLFKYIIQKQRAMCKEFDYNLATNAGVVLTASTIAFQAIGTGSNPVTRSINV